MLMCFILSCDNTVYHIDWLMWNHSCIPRINLTSSWCVNLLCIVEFGLLVFCWEFSPFLKKFYLLIGGKLLYNVVLVSAIQEYKSAIIIYIWPPSWTSLPCPPPPSRSSQSRTSPCYVAISYQLSILHMVVYICQGYFLHCPTLSLPHCIHKSVSASMSSFLPCE